MKNHSRRRLLHDAAITSRQVEEMLRAGAGLQPAFSEKSLGHYRRLRFYRNCLKLAALVILSVYSLAVLKEFFF